MEAEGDGADGGDAAHDVGRVVEEAAPVRHPREHGLQVINNESLRRKFERCRKGDACS